MPGSNESAVGVSMGLTKNLGNYESLRVDAWRTLPVKDGDDAKDVYERAWAEVDAELEAKLKELEE